MNVINKNHFVNEIDGITPNNRQRINNSVSHEFCNFWDWNSPVPQLAATVDSFMTLSVVVDILLHVS